MIQHQKYNINSISTQAVEAETVTQEKISQVHQVTGDNVEHDQTENKIEGDDTIVDNPKNLTFNQRIYNNSDSQTKSAKRPFKLVIEEDDITPELALQYLQIFREAVKKRRNTEKCTINLNFTTKGSTEFILDGSEEDLECLAKLYQSGELQTLVNKLKPDNIPEIIVKKVKFTEDSKVIEKVQLIRAIRQNNWRRADLRRADLNLSGANLTRADLRRADLRRANLRRADLRRAYLIGANLMGANLMGANLMGANLMGANLMGDNLMGADLSGADLRRAYLSGANLMGADLIETNLSGANLSGANLSGANLSGANLNEADLNEADLIGANPSGAYLIAAKLMEADLSWADLRKADLRSADLKRADLSEANVKGAIFTGSQGVNPKLKRKLIKGGAIFDDLPKNPSKELEG